MAFGCEVRAVKMDLLCSERISPDNRFAETDRVVFGDVRVLNNLLESESEFVPKVDYFKQVQSDIKPFMRKMVTSWMLEVSSFFHIP